MAPSYSKHLWQNDNTSAPYGPLNDTRLNEIENGIVGLNGGSAVYVERLKEWAMSEAYEASGTITRNAAGVPTSFNVAWPDGSAGVFTATTVNTTWNAVDAYTITHTVSGKTVTQGAVTRNTAGYITSKPALTVA